ncbi:MAG: pectinesterase family protein, partial [Anaeroplasmataceae bacterium]
YTFVGWYSDSSLSTAYDFSTAVTEDITLYAKWEELVIDDDAISEDVKYSFRYASDESNGYIYITSSATGTTVVDNKLTLSSPSSSYKFETNNSGWFFFQKGSTVKFTLADSAKITLTMYDASSTYTIVGNGLSSSSSDATQSYTAYAGDVTITSTANGYIGFIEITMVDLSTTPVSMELSYLTTSAGSSTSAGNGTYYTTNVKRIYNVGDDFDPSGICASVTFSDETTSGYVSSSSELSFSGFSSLSAGTCTITVTFTRGSTTLTSTYEVYVISQTPSIIDDVLQVKVDMSYTGTLGAIVDGYNMFTRITDALQYLKNYESTYSSNSKLLILEAGTYNEKIEVEIPNLTIKGASAETTIIEYDSLYGLQDPNGFTQVTDSTQTMAIREAAKNFTLYEVTVSNWWNSEERFQSKLEFFIGLNDTAFYKNGKIAEHRALAMLIQADQVIIQNCKLLGYQDTLEGFTGRSMFVDSYISGATDFIFGTNATMYFKNCEIRTIYNGSTDGGYINAFKGCNKGESDYIIYGAIYDGCNFTADAAVTSSNTAIARPWNYYSAVMIMNSTLGAHISKAAYTADTTKNQRYVCWTTNGTTAAEPTSETVKFLEYNNTGDGAISTSQSGVTVLTSQEEANKYNTYSYIFGTTNGAITYSSVWTPVIIEEDEKAVYTVTFNTMGGSSIDSVNVTEGDKLTAPSAPSKDGYVFNGWYTDSSCTTAYNFNSTVTNSFTLYAAWTAASTALTLNAVSGYTEGLYATFDETDASSAAVAYSTDGTTWTSVDSELIRQTSASEARVDVVGLQTGSYSLKVTSSSGKTCIMNNIYVAEDDRSGYAHFGNETGIGAYNNDGTLKSNAVVVYVTDATKNTVTATLGGKTYTGLVSIIQACTSSSYALDIRIIGEIQTTQWNSITYSGSGSTRYTNINNDINYSANSGEFSSNRLTEEKIISLGINSMSNDEANGITKLNGLTNYLMYKGTKSSIPYYDSYWNMCDVKGAYNITVEGIGTDASLFQWGFEFVQCNSIEVKNLTFNNYTEDATGFEGSTSAGKESQYGTYWIHNCEYNIGANNWDVSDEGDKGDGDGSTDIKRCHNVTISYVKYNATHKTNLIGANDGCLQYNISLHHNYYNACSSRLPLVRQANLHMYNNYYYGTTSVSSSIRANCYAFIENNYYEGGKNPYMLVTTNNTSYPGFTQAAFKAIGNVFIGSISLSDSSSTEVYSKENTTTDRTSTVSGTNCKPDGSTSYDNFDTNSTLFYYDSTNKVSDVMLLESASDAKNTVLEYAGVLKTTTLGGPIESGASYTVSFETNGGSSVSNMTVKEGKTITLPTSTKAGYKLVGWYSDSSLTTAFTSQTAVTSNITLYAKWVEATIYTVTFNTNGGSSISSLNVVEGNTISLPTAPTKDGYTFVGWYSDSSLTTAFNESTIISSNITLYAKWRDSSTGELYTPSENISGGGTVFDNDSITLTTNSGTSYVITATGSETATSNDENNFIFTTGLYPGGSSGGYTITAKENCTITIYYTISDSKFASSSDYSKKGNLCVNSVEVESLGDKSNAIAYSYTMEVTAGTTYVLSASSNRLILFGILVK